MRKYLLVILPLLISGCAIGPLVELKLAEEGAKFVEKEIEVLEGTENQKKQ